jgi:hypothetical protein
VNELKPKNMDTVKSNAKSIIELLTLRGHLLNEEELLFIERCVQIAYLDGRIEAIRITNILEQKR